MAWTTARTWTTSEVVTAAMMNEAVRDNTADLDRRTTIVGNQVTTSQTTTSTSFTDLATSGPAVTHTIGASGLCLVTISSSFTNNTDAGGALMGFAVSGASTVAASDSKSIGATFPTAAAASLRAGGAFMVGSLNAGSTTFTAKYRAVSGGTATFQDRYITATPLSS